MQVVILAGGYGTRLSELTERTPKPLVEVGNRPIIWHIMSYYAKFGHTDFIVPLGYKGEKLKEYFRNITSYQSNISLNLKSGAFISISEPLPDWRITFVDTGLDTATGGRLLGVKELLDDEFLMTYGDGLSDVDIDSLIKQHHENNLLATVTAVRPPARFGYLEIENLLVNQFDEKTIKNDVWINGGFFVLKKTALDFISSPDMPFEADPLSKLASMGKLGAFKHYGFWHPMDTLKDKRELDEISRSGKAPWIL
jgi:glucose-1-phosphate cytidylyltransferase